MSSSSSGRQRVQQLSAEDEIFGFMSKEAEEQLAAKRKLQAEAKAIRSQEKERQQEEDQEMSPGSSSGSKTHSHTYGAESTDLETKCRTLEQKYRAAMVMSAQLDNEKQALVYEVEFWRDHCAEREEELARLQQEYKEKCRLFDFQKRDFKNMEQDITALKLIMTMKDKSLEDNGLIFIVGDSGEPVLRKSSELKQHEVPFIVQSHVSTEKTGSVVSPKNETPTTTAVNSSETPARTTVNSSETPAKTTIDSKTGSSVVSVQSDQKSGGPLISEVDDSVDESRPGGVTSGQSDETDSTKAMSDQECTESYVISGSILPSQESAPGNSESDKDSLDNDAEEFFDAVSIPSPTSKKSGSENMEQGSISSSEGSSVDPVFTKAVNGADESADGSGVGENVFLAGATETESSTDVGGETSDTPGDVSLVSEDVPSGQGESVKGDRNVTQGADLESDDIIELKEIQIANDDSQGEDLTSEVAEAEHSVKESSCSEDQVEQSSLNEKTEGDSVENGSNQVSEVTPCKDQQVSDTDPHGDSVDGNEAKNYSPEENQLKSKENDTDHEVEKQDSSQRESDENEKDSVTAEEGETLGGDSQDEALAPHESTAESVPSSEQDTQINIQVGGIEQSDENSEDVVSDGKEVPEITSAEKEVGENDVSVTEEPVSDSNVSIDAEPDSVSTNEDKEESLLVSEPVSAVQAVSVGGESELSDGLVIDDYDLDDIDDVLSTELKAGAPVDKEEKVETREMRTEETRSARPASDVPEEVKSITKSDDSSAKKTKGDKSKTEKKGGKAEKSKLSLKDKIKHKEKDGTGDKGKIKKDTEQERKGDKHKTVKKEAAVDTKVQNATEEHDRSSIAESLDGDDLERALEKQMQESDGLKTQKKSKKPSFFKKVFK